MHRNFIEFDLNHRAEIFKPVTSLSLNIGGHGPAVNPGVYQKQNIQYTCVQLEQFYTNNVN
jgi:hypothetical protein